ncbi:hypothetical protein FGO68_gene1638 [Halteria grandinella]|uniref:RING-type domain-containing protein n=1 Tax=Halteria grandinella TaxID=5974 RepID=A0A8J8NYX2_HALGN|nr:hypothetical protein FGO68_gene1638 [Halteria grandinella]
MIECTKCKQDLLAQGENRYNIYSITCCGVSFCPPCIEILRQPKAQCPLCKQNEYRFIFNEKLTKAIQEF